MTPRNSKPWRAVLAVAIIAWSASDAVAGWEAGAKAGFDTNLSRSINDGEGSGFLSAYGSYWKGHAGETRLDWTLAASVQGASYFSLPDLDFAEATLAPGATYILRPGWTAAVTPFFSGKAVRDSQQSAWTFGGRLDLSQKFQNGAYLGEYYVYTDSRANEDVYSYRENAAGAYVGMRWTPRVFTEAGYEFSRGDSFFSVRTTAVPPTGGGPGRGMRGYSPAFDAEVFKETVNAHAFSATAGVDWTRSWFSTVAYTYKTWDGEGETVNSSSGFAGIGYRF